jgi:iron complex outermembrane recepter protein
LDAGAEAALLIRKYPDNKKIRRPTDVARRWRENRVRKINLYSSTMLAAALVSAATCAHAQTAGAAAARPDASASEQGTSLDAIVVTARRRSEDISRVPISISAFSQEALEQKNVATLADLVKITPGLNISAGGSLANPFITIRGQSKGVVGNISPGVIPYVNEVPLPNNGSMIPTYDMGNVQVLKGPQGTLFGRNAMGGAILAYTNPPTYNFGGYIKGDIASFDFRQLEGAVNLPIVADKVALRLAGQVKDGGSYVHAQLVTPYTVNAAGVATPGVLMPAKHDMDEIRGRSFRASLLLDPTSSISNVTVVEYTKVRGTNNEITSFFPNGYQGGPPASYYRANPTQNVRNLFQCGGGNVACDINATMAFVNGADGKNEITNFDPWMAFTRLWGVTNTTTANVNDHLKIKNILGYRDTKVFSATELDGTGLYIGQALSLIQLKQLTEELQAAGSVFDDKLNYTVGAFYYDEKPGTVGGGQAFDTNIIAGLSHTITNTYLRNRSKAIYGQVDYSFGGALSGVTATAGLRQTWDSVHGCAASVRLSATAPAMLLTQANSPYLMTQDQCLNNTASLSQFPGATAIVAQGLPKKTFNKLTYTLGLNWQVTPDTMVYVAHRRGYRAGGYNTPLFDQPFLGQLQAFTPETITDWEVGSKIRWQAGGVRGLFDIAVFTGKDESYQLPVQVSPGTACVPQAVTASRPANCVTAASAPGVNITHSASTTITNAGALTIRGFEANATVSPVEGLTFGAAAAYLDYKVNSISLDPNLIAFLRAGNQSVPSTIVISQQPKWTYNLDATYVFPDKVLGGTLTATVNYKHSGMFYSPNIFVPAYDVVDSRVTLGDIAGSGLDVAFYVNNLTDEHYFIGGVSGSPATFGEKSYFLARPRSYGVSLRYQFGG